MSGRVSLGAALFFALTAVVLIASVLVVRARTPDLVLEVTEPSVAEPGEFSPGGPGPGEVTITFFVREGDGEAAVGIVDSREDLVRTLDSSAELAEDEPVTYVWDGRTDDGATVAPGRYRLRVELPSEDRVMIWPRRITVLPEAVQGTGGEPE
jgi:hypothetical protein